MIFLLFFCFRCWIEQYRLNIRQSLNKSGYIASPLRYYPCRFGLCYLKIHIMREKKFRAWDLTNKKLVFDGFSILGETTLFSLLAQHSYELNQILNWEIVQFTNLLDKKAQEIYEGDLVKHDSGVIGEVQYEIQAGQYWIKWLGYKGESRYKPLCESEQFGHEGGIQLMSIEIVGNKFAQ